MLENGDATSMKPTLKENRLTVLRYSQSSGRRGSSHPWYHAQSHRQAARRHESHKANAEREEVYSAFGALDVIRIVWPANSPDLNPIENVWPLLKGRIGRRYPFTNAEVRQYLEEKWAKVTLDDFIHYVQEMPERVQAVIAANGGHTKW